MTYFSLLSTVGAVKTEYRRLAKLHHPDVGGDTATMQEINAQYHERLEQLHGQTSTGSDGKEHTYYYRQEVEQEIMDKLAQVLALQMEDVAIEIIGTWLWVHGNTKPHRKKLGKKGLGLTWHSKRQAWYYRRFTYRRTYSGLDMDDLRAAYGSQTFTNDARTAVATV